MGKFVIPDLHGREDLLEKILKKWNPSTHQIIQLGDMVDRGERSLSVVRYLKKAKEEGNAQIVRGNHEEMLLNFLDNPEEEGRFYFDSGGNKTVDSFLGYGASYKKTPQYIADCICSEFQEEIKFIRNLPLYAGWRDWVFVHAGVDFAFLDWRSTSDNDFNNMDYKRFVYSKNEHKLKFVAGHTHTNKVNEDKSNNIWISDCKTKFLLDGDVIQGQLNALVIHDDGTFETIYVK